MTNGKSAPPPTASTKDVEENRLVAALAWLWVLSLIILLLKRDSPYVQFHARQGLVLFVASILLWIALSLLGPFAFFLHQTLNFLIFVVSIVGFVQALRGQWWTLPVLGPLAAKIRL